MLRIVASLLLTLSFAGSVAASCFESGAPCASFDAAAPAPEPSTPARAPQSAKKPVVISIVGVDFSQVGIGKLEIAYFKKILQFFKPGSRLNQQLFEERLASVGEDLAAAEQYKADGVEVKQPDDYLDTRLAAVLPGERYEIAPVRWSRDPDESEAAVLLVEAGIKRIFTKARAEGRPVYLVAHSWGTILAHTALHRLASSAPEVRVDKFVTLGSPLVPGSWWLDIFVDHQINAGHLQQYISKPRNVGYWVNLWARNDYFSNEIRAADKNLRQDGLVDSLEWRVVRAAEANHSLRPAALRDLFFLKSLKTWHFAYIFDFEVYLKTLREAHSQVIFAPVVSGELAY
jgi:hypothetical protein